MPPKPLSLKKEAGKPEKKPGKPKQRHEVPAV